MEVLILGHAAMDSWPLSYIASISSETPLDMSFKAPKQSLVHINPYSILRYAISTIGLCSSSLTIGVPIVFLGLIFFFFLLSLLDTDRERIGAIFLWEGGSSVGEITAHNKVINCVDIKQSRPYRPATGSDDNCSILRGGPPFKFKLTIGVSGLS